MQRRRLAAALAAAVLVAPAADAAAAPLTPRAKAALLVVSGLPAPPGVGGVIVRRWDAHLARPPGALVFADQEGGAVRTFPALPPSLPASAYRSAAEARAAGRATGRALRRVGVDVDLAPIVDLPSGPLGSRHFRSPSLAVEFARGLAEGRAGSCVKHFPGLGSAPVSTDDRPHVDARLVPRELRAFRGAIRAGVPCVMVSNAFYAALGRFRAPLERRTYALLRRQGFRGVAITDSLSIVSEPPRYWPRRAILAGADMLLFTSPEHARRAIDALVPLARRGLLDAKVERVLRLRASLRR